MTILENEAAFVDLILQTAGQKSWSPALYKTVGEGHGVRTIFLGDLSISDIRPGFSLAGVLCAPV